MIIVVTHLRLKSIWKFFSLANRARLIQGQFRRAPGHIKLRTRGFWKDHYTLSAWDTRENMQAFARSGKHLDAMKRSKEIAELIRTYTYEADEIPDWKSARALLDKGRRIEY